MKFIWMAAKFLAVLWAGGMLSAVLDLGDRANEVVAVLALTVGIIVAARDVKKLREHKPMPPER